VTGVEVHIDSDVVVKMTQHEAGLLAGAFSRMSSEERETALARALRGVGATDDEIAALLNFTSNFWRACYGPHKFVGARGDDLSLAKYGEWYRALQEGAPEQGGGQQTP
jgi:hypothetical protein